MKQISLSPARILAAVAILACAFASAWAQPGSARAPVDIPALKGAGVVMLDLSVSARNPAGGNVGGVVRLRRPGGQAVEIGRFSIFGSGEQSYQLNVAGALKQLGLTGGQAEVEVTPVDRSGGAVPAGVEISIGRAQIVTR